MESAPSSSRVFWGQHARCDQWGIVASCLCAVHCGLGALIVGASGFTRTIFRDERIELTFFLAAVGLAIVSLTTGYRRHHRSVAVLFGLCGLSLLGIGRAMEAPRMVEALLSVLGATLLIVAHVLNARLIHRLGSCCAAR